MYKVIMVKGQNVPPEEEVQERIDALGEGWELVTIQTDQMAWGEMSPGEYEFVRPMHVYYITTVIMKRVSSSVPLNE